MITLGGIRCNRLHKWYQKCIRFIESFFNFVKENRKNDFPAQINKTSTILNPKKTTCIDLENRVQNLFAYLKKQNHFINMPVHLHILTFSRAKS